MSKDEKNQPDDIRLETRVSDMSDDYQLGGVEKSADEKSVNSQGDEALLLVGMERKAEFSEEYNLKLRRKLVCQICQPIAGLSNDHVMRNRIK